ncbi:MAG: hypothetical protein M3Y35_18665, partial [Actinomycetota bacterium]|nr:hypothetical protein [Actinomycetota bacterium]
LPATVNCPPGCDHSGPDGGPDSTGVGCALDAFVTAGGAKPGRLASFRRLLSSKSGGAVDNTEADSSSVDNTADDNTAANTEFRNTDVKSGRSHSQPGSQPPA